jgi:hypothetical protein
VPARNGMLAVRERGWRCADSWARRPSGRGTAPNGLPTAWGVLEREWPSSLVRASSAVEGVRLRRSTARLDGHQPTVESQDGRQGRTGTRAAPVHPARPSASPQRAAFRVLHRPLSSVRGSRGGVRVGFFSRTLLLAWKKPAESAAAADYLGQTFKLAPAFARMAVNCLRGALGN